MGKPTKKAMKDFLHILRPHDELAALVLSKGIWFNGRANASDYEITPEWQREMRPRAGQCFTNAQSFCLEVWDHCYFEGYVLASGSIPMQHAWIVMDDRRVVDFTLEAMERKAKRAKVSCDTSNALYLGVEVPKKFVRMQLTVTAETLLRQFRVYGCIITSEKVGRVVHATRLTSRQRQILNQLSLPTPAQTLRRILDPVPTG